MLLSFPVLSNRRRGDTGGCSCSPRLTPEEALLPTPNAEDVFLGNLRNEKSCIKRDERGEGGTRVWHQKVHTEPASGVGRALAGGEGG